jgi:hypothetical protein
MNFRSRLRRIEQALNLSQSCREHLKQMTPQERCCGLAALLEAISQRAGIVTAGLESIIAKLRAAGADAEPTQSTLLLGQLRSLILVEGS